MLHRLYMRTLALAASPRAPWWLAAVAFAESSFFPIPPDALLIPMALARPDRAWRFAAICTGGSVVGGALGYAIGYCVFDQLSACRSRTATVTARPVRRVPGAGMPAGGCAVILIKGLTPIPVQDRHDRLRCGEVQLPGVHGGQHRHARRAVLPGRRLAAVLRHSGARLHRAAADIGDQPARRRRRRRLPGAEAAVAASTRVELHHLAPIAR